MPPDGERFARRSRLTSGEDIQRVRTEGTRQRTPLFEIRTAPSSLTYPRVAIVVPRYGATAVARNRVKRRLRELVRREMLPVLEPGDVVIRATPLAYRASFVTLRDEVRGVLARRGGG